MSLLITVLWHGHDQSYYDRWFSLIGQYLLSIPGSRTAIIYDDATPPITAPGSSFLFYLAPGELGLGIGAKREMALNLAKGNSIDYLLMLDDNVVNVYHLQDRTQTNQLDKFIQQAKLELQSSPYNIVCGASIEHSPELLNSKKQYGIINSFALNKCYLFDITKMRLLDDIHYDPTLARFGEDIDMWLQLIGHGFHGRKLTYFVISRMQNEKSVIRSSPPSLNYEPYINFLDRHKEALFGRDVESPNIPLPEFLQRTRCHQCDLTHPYPPLKLWWKKGDYEGQIYQYQASEAVLPGIMDEPWCEEKDRRHASPRNRGKGISLDWDLCYRYNLNFKDDTSNKYGLHWLTTTQLYLERLVNRME